MNNEKASASQIHSEIEMLTDVLARAQTARAYGHSASSVQKNTELAFEAMTKIAALRGDLKDREQS